MLKRIAKNIVEHKVFIILVAIVIGTNFVVLVFETMPREMNAYWLYLKALDRIFLIIFVFELLLKIVAYRLRFFWPFQFWNWFDFIIVCLSFFGSFSAFRALRLFLLFNLFPKLKSEIEVFW